MVKYARVSFEQRCQISVLLETGFSAYNIAKKLNLHKSTIYREIKRNCVRVNSDFNQSPQYIATRAHAKAIHRFKRCRRKLIVSGEVEEHVKFMLRHYRSPEQISGRLTLEKIGNVGHQAIYNYIRRHSELTKYLTYRGIKRYRHQRNQKGMLNYTKKNISQRSQAANKRKEIGHWERDLMYACKSPLLVCTDRKSRFTLFKAIDSATSSDVQRETHNMLKNEKVFSITNDNGAEFKNTNYPTYFCDPYRPQQRGTVENTIGVIRRFIKKKMSLEGVDIKAIEMWLNFRPMKVLDYRTPYEVFYRRKVALAMRI